MTTLNIIALFSLSFSFFILQQAMDYTYTNPQHHEEANRGSAEEFPRSVLDRATAAKLRLENYYKTALEQAHERNQRLNLFFFESHQL